jgi:hypothetical protein
VEISKEDIDNLVSQIRAKKQADTSAGVDAFEAARLEKMALEAQKLQQPPKDVSPLVTFGKEYVGATAPAEVLSPKLREAATITEADERNPEARSLGWLAGQAASLIPLDAGAAKGAVGKSFKSMLKDVAEKQTAYGNQIGALAPEEAQKKLAELSARQMKEIAPSIEKEFAESKTISPETMERVRDHVLQMMELKKKDIPLSDSTFLAKGKDGHWHKVVGEQETMLPFDALPPGKGTNAVLLDNGEVLLPQEKKMLPFMKLAEQDPDAAQMVKMLDITKKLGQSGKAQFLGDIVNSLITAKKKMGKTDIDDMQAPIVSNTEFKATMVDPVTGTRTFMYGPRTVQSEKLDEIVKKQLDRAKGKK